jgi:hypothetical protein
MPNCSRRRAPKPPSNLTPLDRLLRQLSERATDPAVKRWAAALLRGESDGDTVEAHRQVPDKRAGGGQRVTAQCCHCCMASLGGATGYPRSSQEFHAPGE